MIETFELSDTILVVVDVQERMMNVIHEADVVIDNIDRLVRGCRRLGIPILTTEQYSKGLGPTVEPIRTSLGDDYRPLDKMTFSAAADIDFMQAYEASGKHSIMICGVETHVCVYQTARDLFNLGWNVEVVGDAVGSRNPRNRDLALNRLRKHGVDITTVEMALFSLIETAEAEEFRDISAIVK